MKFKFMNPSLVLMALALTCVLQGCASTSKQALQPDAGNDQQVTETDINEQASDAEDPPQIPAEPIDVEVMYNVFAAELLGSEGDLEGAVAVIGETRAGHDPTGGPKRKFLSRLRAAMADAMKFPNHGALGASRDPCIRTRPDDR